MCVLIGGHCQGTARGRLTRSHASYVIDLRACLTFSPALILSWNHRGNTGELAGIDPALTVLREFLQKLTLPSWLVATEIVGQNSVVIHCLEIVHLFIQSLIALNTYLSILADSSTIVILCIFIFNYQTIQKLFIKHLFIFVGQWGYDNIISCLFSQLLLFTYTGLNQGSLLAFSNYENILDAYLKI